LITLEGVKLTVDGLDQDQLIQQLINDGKLVIDSQP